MKRTIFLLLMYAMTAAVAASQTAQSKDSTEKYLLALENAWNQAQLHYDANALSALVADGFVNTDYDGTFQNRAEFLTSLKDPNYRPESVANDGVVVHLFGNTAIVTGNYRAKGTYKGKLFDHRGRFTDTWINLNGKWQCVASHSSLAAR